MIPAPIDERLLRGPLAPFGSSTGLPAVSYTSPDVYAWERTYVFDASWFCLGRAADLLPPGHVRALGHGGESILITRDTHGAPRAFFNVCRHRGHQLVLEGAPVAARLVRCPYHSWSYGLDGDLRSAPTMEGSPSFEATEYPLREIAAATFAGWLFLAMSTTAPPLEDHVGNLADLLAPYDPARLVAAASLVYDVAANWKLLVENYSECYHCTSIHPALCKVTPPDSGVDIAPTGLWCGGTMELREHAVTMSTDGTSGAGPLPGLDGDRRVLYAALLPNLLISAHPDYVMTHRLEPRSPGSTRVECTWFFDPAAAERPGFDPGYAVDFWDLTNREDWAACESVQRGMASAGHSPGPLGPMETTVHQFTAMMARAYAGRGLTPAAAPARGASG